MMENDCRVREREKETDVEFVRRQKKKTGITWVENSANKIPGILHPLFQTPG